MRREVGVGIVDDTSRFWLLWIWRFELDWRWMFASDYIEVLKFGYLLNWNGYNQAL